MGELSYLLSLTKVRMEQVLVETKGGDSYTAEDIPQLLTDLGAHQLAAVFPTVSNLTKRSRVRAVLVHIPAQAFGHHLVVLPRLLQ